MHGVLRCKDCGLELDGSGFDPVLLSRALAHYFKRECRLVFVCADCGRTTEAPGGEVLNTLAWHARACSDRDSAVRPVEPAKPGRRR